MRAHLDDKECNARNKLKLHLPYYIPMQAYSRGAIQHAMSETWNHQFMQDPCSSILYGFDKPLCTTKYDVIYMAWQLT